MLVSYLPFRLAQKHYFQSRRKRGGGGGKNRRSNMAFTLTVGGRWGDARRARDRLGLQLLRLVANNSSSFPTLPRSSVWICSLYLLPSPPPAPHRSYSRLCYASLAASNGNTMLRIDAVCKRFSGVTRHPVDLVRATAADNDIALVCQRMPTVESPQCRHIVWLLHWEITHVVAIFNHQKPDGPLYSR